MVGRLADAGPRVAVLMGGLSAEREVSLSSGHECAKALRVAGYDVVAVDAGRDLAARLQDIKPDCCSTRCMRSARPERRCWSA